MSIEFESLESVEEIKGALTRQTFSHPVIN